MSFLAPLFFLGALALAGPVIFHLIRRTTRQRKVFGSLMFLRPSPPRLTRRSRIEHILLLLLRCAVLGLLAAAFARPFFKQHAPAAPVQAAKRVLVLVDDSASMRRANLWADAQARASALFHAASPADQVAVFTFDRRLRPVMGFEQWNAAVPAERAALASGKLGQLSPGWSGTHLGAALIAAAETLADSDAKAPSTARKQLVVISDLQEGSRVQPLQGYEWPRGIELSVQLVKPRHVSNASLQLLNPADDGPPTSIQEVRIRVSNSPDSRVEQFKVGWTLGQHREFIGAALSAYVPPGQSRTVSLPIPTNRPAPDRIVLQGDEEDFDNTVFVTPPERSALTVLYVGSESESDTRQPLYFLRRAFQDTQRQTVNILRRAPAQPLNPAEVQAAGLLVLAEAMPDELARALQALVANGKTLLVLFRTQQLAPTLARLLDVDGVQAQEARPDNYAMLAEVDFRHPLFAPFADPRFSDFTKIHFWRYRRLDLTAVPGARCIAKFDSGDPALIEKTVGQGRVWILTSGWDPADSQLALSTKFVPLLYSMLEQSGAPSPKPAQYLVGEEVPLGETSRDASPKTVSAPDGRRFNLAAGQARFAETSMPGLYTLDGPAPPARRFAVNLDPTESRTAPLALDELERLGAPLAQPAARPALQARRQTDLRNAELENRQKLWRWLIVTAMVVVLIETWLAGRTARQPRAALAIMNEGGAN